MLALIIAAISVTAHADIAGRLAAFQSGVEINSKVLGRTLNPVLGMDISEGDTITVGESASAKVIMYDNNEINLLANTTLTVDHYDSDHHNAGLTLKSGRARFIVHQQYDGDKSKFEVETPSAHFDIKGTDFLLEQTKANARVVTFTGTVQMSGHKGTPVAVTAGQAASVKGQTPSKAASLKSYEVAELDRQSKIDPMSPNDKPAPKPTQASPKKKHRRQAI